VHTERGGRKGKTVTVAGPFHLPRDEARRLVGLLKRECGSGGTLKTVPGASGQPGQTMEIQGDHVDRVVARLRREGFAARRAGG
jgi:translation initiation factor 1